MDINGVSNFAHPIFSEEPNAALCRLVDTKSLLQEPLLKAHWAGDPCLDHPTVTSVGRFNKETGFFHQALGLFKAGSFIFMLQGGEEELGNFPFAKGSKNSSVS